MPTKIGQKVQNFYNETPFPDYELKRFNKKEDLLLSAHPFAKILNRSIPKNASIIDIGTGTGQLSAYLSLNRQNVFGIDFSDSSLNKALALKEKLQLNSLTLKKVDILDKKAILNIGQNFDYVLCMGVLHHTGNAYQGFHNILNLLAPEGKIVIGLYNTYGRIPLNVRQFLAKTVFKKNEKIKKWFIQMQIEDLSDKEKLRGWWNDQYLHPHETTHTAGEVIRWFKKNNIKYIQSFPSLELFDQSDPEISGIWNPEKYKSHPHLFARFVRQLQWFYQTHHEGGYWLTFGKKGAKTNP